eukprot:TRINITY_DN22124_c0_g2_i1.p1 TRINITY_DN22124_c0_g2~~TRINITY_DN22124_c0_g2_i1.p1  ORF type:complete len:324 (+),score=83.71 TRINITY_DN22124_c0_g2_i1:240-1211(+)
MAALEVKLGRLDRVYRPGEVVKAMCVITNPSGSLSHTGIRYTASGKITLQVSGKGFGVLDTLQQGGAAKTICLLNKADELQKPGYLPAGKTEISFEFLVEKWKQSEAEELYETYHGAYITIQYVLSVEMLRGMLLKTLTAATEFIVEGRTGSSSPSTEPAEVKFVMTPDTQPLLPSLLRPEPGSFRVSGCLATRCCVTAPLVGEVVVEAAALPIRSVEVKLLRVETEGGERRSREVTEIQTTQIAAGDICRGLAMPIHLILPRLFTCPSIEAGLFTLQFQTRVVVTFGTAGEGRIRRRSSAALQADTKALVVAETLPLILLRG